MLSADVLMARQAAELSPASSLPSKSLSQIPGYHKKICMRVGEILPERVCDAEELKKKQIVQA